MLSIVSLLLERNVCFLSWKISWNEEKKFACISLKFFICFFAHLHIFYKIFTKYAQKFFNKFKFYFLIFRLYNFELGKLLISYGFFYTGIAVCWFVTFREKFFLNEEKMYVYQFVIFICFFAHSQVLFKNLRIALGIKVVLSENLEADIF